MTIDWLVSVDDHVVEPPNVWLDRVPARYREAAPHVVTEDGHQVWVYEDKRGMTFVTLAVEAVRPADGAVVCKGRSMMIVRGGGA